MPPDMASAINSYKIWHFEAYIFTHCIWEWGRWEGVCFQRFCGVSWWWKVNAFDKLDRQKMTWSFQLCTLDSINVFNRLCTADGLTQKHGCRLSLVPCSGTCEWGIWCRCGVHPHQYPTGLFFLRAFSYTCARTRWPSTKVPRSPATKKRPSCQTPSSWRGGWCSTRTHFFVWSMSMNLLRCVCCLFVWLLFNLFFKRLVCTFSCFCAWWMGGGWGEGVGVLVLSFTL